MNTPANASNADEETRLKEESSNKLPQKKWSLPKIGGVLGGLFLLAFVSLIWYTYFGPRYGTIHYGICKVFAEQYVHFPTTMKVRDVQYWGVNARVFVSHIDAAGQSNYNSIECKFNVQTLEITRIRIDRRPYSDLETDPPLNPKILEDFNRSIPAILAEPPSLLLPRSLRGRPLEDLWLGGG